MKNSKNAPLLKWERSLSSLGQYMAMRVDTKPFNDIRVRRALNMAIDKKEIVKRYYGGNVVLHGFPLHPDFYGYYEPLEEMPLSVKELFDYNPNKAKQLLAQAGYPQGFKFKVQVCACSPDHMELLLLMAAYLARIGVGMEIQPLEYSAFLSAMTTGKHAPGYMMNTGHGNPTMTLTKNFYSGQTWNASRWSDPKFDASLDKMLTIRDEKQLQAEIKKLNCEIMEQAPYIFLPIQYSYTAWWPSVKNYGGELPAGAERPAPIYARTWVDLALKKKLGY